MLSTWLDSAVSSLQHGDVNLMDQIQDKTVGKVTITRQVESQMRDKVNSVMATPTNRMGHVFWSTRTLMLLDSVAVVRLLLYSTVHLELGDD